MSPSHPKKKERFVEDYAWDGIYATIPNRKVCSEVLKNYSKYKERRLELVVGVDYDSNLEKVQATIAKALAREDLPILKDPEPVIAPETPDTSSINFKVLFLVQHRCWGTLDYPEGKTHASNSRRV